MKVILKKVRTKTWFTWVEPIVCEPLELEYIKSAIGDLATCEIVDPQFKDTMSKCDIVILSGYNTARHQVVAEAQAYKKAWPGIKVIVSGIDAQINYEEYQTDYVDYIFIGTSLVSFRAFFIGVRDKAYSGMVECLYQVKNCWEMAPRVPLEKMETIIASRDYLKAHLDETFYLDYKGLALVKNSIGCPYGCLFCYCKNLNDGIYVSRDYSLLFDELNAICASYYWIVDDILVNSVDDIVDFHKASKLYPQVFSIICYMRSDTIIKCADYLHLLKEAGVFEVIVGFEAVKDSDLKTYNKGLTKATNEKACGVLRGASLSYTALFMVHPEDEVKDFKALKTFIKGNDIPMYTFSIFTPLKGTDIYEGYEDKIEDMRPKSYDFLHLVLPSKHMSRLRFNYEFLKLHLFQFCHSKRSRSIVFSRIFKR